MYFWIVSLLIGCVTPGHDTESVIRCDGLIYRDQYHDKYLLFEGPGKPNNMFFDRYSGHLLFSHTVTNGREIDFRIMTCHVKNQICKTVEGVPGGYAIAYDYSNDEIYLGGHQGLYKYNIDTNEAEHFAERGKSVWGIFIRRQLYYIQHPSQQLYVYKHRKFKMVPETIGFEIDNFFVSKDFEVYFSNRSGLYKAKANKKEKKPYLLNNKIEVRQITEDIYGIVHFCASDGVYIEDKSRRNVKKIVDIDQAYSITFAVHFHLASEEERNILLYSDKYAIYVLMRSNNSELCSRVYKSRSANTPVQIIKVALDDYQYSTY